MKTTPLLALVALLALCTASAHAFTGKVESVHDGDTITVDGVRVRLSGIDAPELAQPGGRASREYLAAMVLGAPVEIIPQDRDKYGRVVAEVRLEGTDVNAEMVKAGHAWVYRQYCHTCFGLRMAETAARWRGIGLWADPSPVPPWMWRKQHRRN